MHRPGRRGQEGRGRGHRSTLEESDETLMGRAGGEGGGRGHEVLRVEGDGNYRSVVIIAQSVST